MTRDQRRSVDRRSQVSVCRRPYSSHSDVAPRVEQKLPKSEDGPCTRPCSPKLATPSRVITRGINGAWPGRALSVTKPLARRQECAHGGSPKGATLRLGLAGLSSSAAGDFWDGYSSRTALAGSRCTARFAGTQAASKAADATSNDPDR